MGYVSTPRTGRLRFQLAQTDRRVLDRFQKAVLGLGRIYGPYATHGGNDRPIFQFQAASFEQIQAIVAMLYQFLSPVKQEQCLGALKKFEANPKVWGRLPREL